MYIATLETQVSAHQELLQEHVQATASIAQLQSQLAVCEREEYIIHHSDFIFFSGKANIYFK